MLGNIFLPWLGLSRREKGGEGSNAQNGKDRNGAGGSSREGERQDVGLPSTQGSSMSLAQIWSSPLRSPVNEKGISRLIVPSGKVPFSHRQKDECEALKGPCIHICYPASAKVAFGGIGE